MHIDINTQSNDTLLLKNVLLQGLLKCSIQLILQSITMENGDLMGKMALKDSKLSNALYQDIVSKNFQVIQSFLKKINVIYARQEQLQQNIEIVNNKVKNLEIQNKHLHHEFRNVNGLIDRKLNSFIQNDSRFKRRLSRFGKGQNIRNPSKKVSLLIYEQGKDNDNQKSQSVCDNISQLSEELLNTSEYIQSSKLKLSKKQPDISCKVKAQLNDMIKQNFQKTTNQLETFQSALVTSQHQSKVKFQSLNQQIHEYKKNCLKRSAFQQIKAKMQKQFQLMVDKRIAQAKQQIKIIFVDLLAENKKQIQNKVLSIQKKANDEISKFKEQFSAFEDLESYQENFKTLLDKQEKKLAQFIYGKEDNFANREQTKSALRFMEDKINELITSQGILKRDVKILKGKSNYFIKQGKNGFSNAITHKCLGCNSFVELDLFPFSQLDQNQNINKTADQNESKLIKKSSHFYNSQNKMTKSISASVINTLKKRSMQVLAKQPKFQ